MALTQVDQGLLGTYAQYTGFKNRIINGALGIWQRGTTTSTNTAYMADRFWGSTSGSGTYAYARDTNTPSAAFLYSAKVSNTTITSAQYLRLNQNIESININDFVVGDTFTVSFWARSANNEGSIQTYYGYPTAVDNFNGGVTFPSNTSGTVNAVTSTWTRYTQTYTVTASGSVTPAYGLQLIISYSPATSGSREFQVTGVQLEKGTTATSFDYRPYGTELALCQRYYNTSYNGSGGAVGSATTTNQLGYWGTTTFTYNGTLVSFPVAMRSTPTVTIYSPNTGTSAKMYYITGSPADVAASVSYANPLGFWGTVYNVSTTAGNDLRFHYSASIEL